MYGYPKIKNNCVQRGNSGHPDVRTSIQPEGDETPTVKDPKSAEQLWKQGHWPCAAEAEWETDGTEKSTSGGRMNLIKRQANGHGVE